MTNRDGKYLRIKPTLWRWEDDGKRRYTIFVSGRKELVLLNPLGSIIYANCNGTKTLEDIVAIISANFPSISEEKIRRDTEAFIKHMINTGSIECYN